MAIREPRLSQPGIRLFVKERDSARHGGNSGAHDGGDDRRTPKVEPVHAAILAARLASR